MDASILITANVPSAKKIIVHGPTEPDEGAIPSQFPISEDIQVRMLMKFTLAHANLIIGMAMSSIITKRNSLQFCQLQQEALDFFGIEESKMLVEKILRFCYCHFVTLSLSHFLTLSLCQEYFLVDQKTRKIHNPLHFVRDFYFFKRSFCNILCTFLDALASLEVQLGKARYR